MQWPHRVKNAILNFLKATENIVWDPVEYNNTQRYDFDINYKTKTHIFELAQEFWDLEEIKQGTLIGMDGEVQVWAEYDWVILFSHNRYAVDQEAFCMGRAV